MVDLIDLVLEGFKEIITWIVSKFELGLIEGYKTFTEIIFGTPTPKTDGPFVFGEPSNPPWTALLNH